MKLPEKGGRIERWPLERLKPYAQNPRTHSPAQVAKIAASIQEFGFTNPILVDGEAGIIAGHGRLAAARQLGLAEVPVIELTHLSEAQKRAYRIADNRLALESGWDEALLASEIRALEEGDFACELTGFSELELAALLDGHGGTEDRQQEDIPVIPPKPVSRPGDLWLLARHRLLCGDALDPAQVDALLAGARARLAVTDPPWNAAIGQSWSYRKRRRPALKNDDIPQAEFDRFLHRAANAIARIAAGDVYVFMSSTQWPNIDAAMRGAGLHRSGTLAWVKDIFVLGRSNYHPRFEPIWYGWAAKGRSSFCGRRDLDDVWEFPRPRRSEEHPTMKPVELIVRAIENSSVRRGTVVDLFGGAGSTLIACEQTGRRCMTMEIDPGYTDVIVQRWQNSTGESATLESSGRRFDEVALERRGGAA